MGYENIGKSMVISCDSCRNVCVVGSDEAFTVPEDPRREPYTPNDRRTIPERAYIVVRVGRVDHRHTRVVPRSPDGDPQIIDIREYPYLCDDCYETGGYGKLDAAGWQPVHVKQCSQCSKVFAHEDVSRRQCRACAPDR